MGEQELKEIAIESALNLIGALEGVEDTDFLDAVISAVQSNDVFALIDLKEDLDDEEIMGEIE
jgi:hypothetical protein